MNRQFTIRDFIDNRSADAKTELSKVDPTFVLNVETIIRVQQLGLVLPAVSSLPIPTTRLSEVWHELLSVSMEIVQELERLDLTVSLLDPNNSEGIDRQLDTYYFDVWIQQVFNLCEKVKRLVAKSCRLLLRRLEQTDWKDRETYYRKLIKENGQDEIEQLRSPAVHGAGGKGLLASRVITEEHQGWELVAVVGPKMVDEIIAAMNSDEDLMSPDQFFNILKAKADFVVTSLGAILLRLDRELSESGER